MGTAYASSSGVSHEGAHCALVLSGRWFEPARSCQPQRYVYCLAHLLEVNMRKLCIGGSAAMFVLTVLGCGGTSNSSDTWTCNQAASTGLCYEWSAPKYLNSSDVGQLQQALQQNCTSSQGAMFSIGANCPTMNRIGTCAVSYVQERGVPENIVLYAPTHSAPAGQAVCASARGTWTPE